MCWEGRRESNNKAENAAVAMSGTFSKPMWRWGVWGFLKVDQGLQRTWTDENLDLKCFRQKKKPLHEEIQVTDYCSCFPVLVSVFSSNRKLKCHFLIGLIKLAPSETLWYGRYSCLQCRFLSLKQNTPSEFVLIAGLFPLQRLKADVKMTCFLSASLIDADRILCLGIALIHTHSVHCSLLFDIECVWMRRLLLYSAGFFLGLTWRWQLWPP